MLIPLFLADALSTSRHALAATLEPGVTLSSDSESIYLGDGVTIEIEAVGLTEPLDTAPLHRHADLVRESGGTRIGVVGGRVVEVVTRRLEFLPRAEGTVVFGPLTGESVRGAVRSNALTVAVLPPADIDWRPGANDIDTSFTLSAEAPVLGERLVADLVLRHRHAIADEAITLPDFDGFDTLTVFERRRTIVEAEDGAWRQIAWRWLLFPTRSGEVAIDPVRWKGEMIRSRTQRGRFERRVDPPPLAVAPSLSEAGEWWLPARAVTLEESWSSDIRELSAGDEIVRTITLVAEGVLARQLPSVTPLESRSITSTALGERREQTLVGERVTATGTYTFRLHARSPVPVFLDTVRVGWWDTDTREADESIVPARRINVGLPKRADLLRDLALKESPATRLRLWMSSHRDGETFLWALLALLCVTLAALLLPPRRARAAANARGSGSPADTGSFTRATDVLPPL